MMTQFKFKFTSNHYKRLMNNECVEYKEVDISIRCYDELTLYNSKELKSEGSQLFGVNL